LDDAAATAGAGTGVLLLLSVVVDDTTAGVAATGASIVVGLDVTTGVGTTAGGGATGALAPPEPTLLPVVTGAEADPSPSPPSSSAVPVGPLVEPVVTGGTTVDVVVVSVPSSLEPAGTEEPGCGLELRTGAESS
jgi:hypothetical protein